MKTHRIILVGAFVALILLGISIGFLRHRTTSLSPLATKMPPWETNLSPSIIMQATNPPVLPTGKILSRDNRRSAPLQLMEETLDLSHEQAIKLEPILEAQQKQLAAFRRETSLSRPQRMARLKEMHDTDDDQFKAILTPEQFEKWRKRGLNLQEAIQHEVSSSP